MCVCVCVCVWLCRLNNGESVVMRVVPASRSRHVTKGTPGMGEGVGGVYYGGIPYSRHDLGYLQQMYRSVVQAGWRQSLPSAIKACVIHLPYTPLVTQPHGRARRASWNCHIASRLA